MVKFEFSEYLPTLDDVQVILQMKLLLVRASQRLLNKGKNGIGYPIKSLYISEKMILLKHGIL